MKLKMDKSSYKSAENWKGEKTLNNTGGTTSAKDNGTMWLKSIQIRSQGMKYALRLMALKMFLVVKFANKQDISNGTWLHSKTEVFEVLKK